MRTTQRIDALIGGGGPAGVAAAITLRRLGLHVVLVDQTKADAFKVGEGLIPAAQRILTELGAGATWLADGHLPSMGNCAAWGSDHLAEMDFIRSVDGPGWHLDRTAFDAGLRTLAVAAGVQVWAGVRMHAFAREGDGWQVELEEEGGRRMVQANWLLDATGRPHTVARRLGAKRVHLDGLAGYYVLMTASLPGDLDSMSMIEAVPEGWWYSARLPDGRRIVVLFADVGSAAAVMAQGMEGYVGLLVQTLHIMDRLEEFGYVPAGPPQAVDARSGRLPTAHGAAWMALGDAAMAFDPLSSQGIYTALYAGLMAGRALGEYCGGDHQALLRYQAQLDAVWDAYLAHWQTYYAMEKRWPEAEFWRMRQGIAAR